MNQRKNFSAAPADIMANFRDDPLITKLTALTISSALALGLCWMVGTNVVALSTFLLARAG